MRGVVALARGLWSREARVSWQTKTMSMAIRVSMAIRLWKPKKLMLQPMGVMSIPYPTQLAMTKLVLLLLLNWQPCSEGSERKKAYMLERSMPDAMGPSQQTRRQCPRDWSASVRAMMTASEQMMHLSLVLKESGTQIQSMRQMQLGSQKRRLYSPEWGMSETWLLMAQVGIQLPMPSSTVAQSSMSRQMQSSDVREMRCWVGSSVGGYEIYGRGWERQRGRMRRAARLRAVQVWSWRSMMRKGPQKAPTPKMKPRNCMFLTACYWLKTLKLRLTRMMLMMTKHMEAVKRLRMRLGVEQEREQARRAAARAVQRQARRARMVRSGSRAFMRKPPAMLADERTRKMQEKWVQSSPVAWLQRGMRGPQEETYQPVTNITQMETQWMPWAVMVYQQQYYQKLVSWALAARMFGSSMRVSFCCMLSLSACRWVTACRKAAQLAVQARRMMTKREWKPKSCMEQPMGPASRPSPMQLARMKLALLEVLDLKPWSTERVMQKPQSSEVIAPKVTGVRMQRMWQSSRYWRRRKMKERARSEVRTVRSLVVTEKGSSTHTILSAKLGSQKRRLQIPE